MEEVDLCRSQVDKGQILQQEVMNFIENYFLKTFSKSG